MHCMEITSINTKLPKMQGQTVCQSTEYLHAYSEPLKDLMHYG